MESRGSSTKSLATDSKQSVKNQFGLGSSNLPTVRDDLSRISGKRIEIADEILFQGPVVFAELPQQPISEIARLDTTPSVLNRTRLKTRNTVATSITNFLGGQDGQEIKILGDAFTTLVNGTFIKTNTAANKLLAVNKVYTFSLWSGIWIENS